MIYCLTGKIVKKSLNAVVLSCGGVGYYTQCPASVAGALPGVGQETTLYTVMSVTENDVSLYGFARFPLLSLRDIFPRRGGSLSSKGEPLAVHANFISLPRPLPLGEVDLRSKDGEGEDAIRCAPSKKGTPERPQVFRCSKV